MRTKSICEKCRKETKELFEVFDKSGSQLLCNNCAPLRFISKNNGKLETPNALKAGRGY